jgi:hypothetical protein
MDPTNSVVLPIAIDPSSTIGAMVDQIIRSPASLLTILFVSILAYCLEIWPKFPSKVIPLLCILLFGPLLYFGLVSPKTVPSSFPYPWIVLGVNGVIVGFIASIVHVSLIRWLIKRFEIVPLQPPSNQDPLPKP